MDLTDEQWDLVSPLLPVPRPSGGRGRPPLDQRALLDGVLWKFRHRRPWRSIPPRYASHQACYQHFQRWKRLGLTKKIMQTLLDDVETRGWFDMQRAIKTGSVDFRWQKGRCHIYIHADLIGSWQVSTAMLYYQNLAEVYQRKQQRHLKDLERA